MIIIITIIFVIIFIVIIIIIRKVSGLGLLTGLGVKLWHMLSFGGSGFRASRSKHQT